MNSSFTAPNSPNENQATWHWSWSAALAGLVLFTLAVRYALPIRDEDIFFHLLYAKYFLSHHTLIPDHTIYSWTPTTNDTIYCAWLSELFFYLLYMIGNISALIAFRYLCALLFVFSVWRYAKKLGLATHPLVWLICLLGTLMSHVAIFAKPEIFSYVFMTLTVWNWWHIRTAGEKAWANCYFFPLIMLLWVNSHGAFIFGVVFLILCGLSELMNLWFSPEVALTKHARKHLYAALTIGVLMVLCTPYGYHYPLQLLAEIMPTKDNLAFVSHIAAHTAPLSVAAHTQTYTDYANSAVIIVIFLVLRNFRTTQMEWSALLTNLTFAILYTQFLRTTFFWAPVFAFSAIYLLVRKNTWPWFRLKKNRALAAIVIIIWGVLISFRSLTESIKNTEVYAWTGFGLNESVPVEEAAFIKANYKNYRIGNTYDQGTYLLWTMWPESKILIDARHFPYREWSSEYWEFAKGQNVQEFTEKYPCDLWIISLVTSPRTCLWFNQSPDWNLAFYSKSSAVFVKKGLPLPENSPRTGKGIDEIRNLMVALRCFVFATNIKDLDTAQRIVYRVNQQFKTLRPKEVAAVNTFYRGVAAYFNGDYPTAAVELAATDRETITNDELLFYSLVMASDAAWWQGNDYEALELSQKSLNLLPFHPFAVYNTAAIRWYQEKHAAGTPALLKKSDTDSRNWRSYLEVFAEKTPKNQRTRQFIEIAEHILNGSYDQRPKLMLPSHPENPSLSIADDKDILM